MLETVLKECNNADALIMNAAVLDYVPVTISDEKWESGREEITIKLKPTKKIIDEVRRHFPDLPIVIFKLEKKPTDLQAFIGEEVKNYLQLRKMNIVIFNFLEELGTDYYVVSDHDLKAVKKTNRISLAKTIHDLLLSYW